MGGSFLLSSDKILEGLFDCVNSIGVFEMLTTLKSSFPSESLNQTVFQGDDQVHNVENSCDFFQILVDGSDVWLIQG